MDKELINVNKITNNKFLNIYKLKYAIYDNTRYEEKNYFMSSRKTKKNLVCMNKINNIKADACMVIPVDKDNNIIMIKEFRETINDYIYSFPAGIMEINESEDNCAIRELKEETGLEVLKIKKLINSRPSCVGISDECISIYIALVDGELTNKYQNLNEDISFIKIKQNDIINSNTINKFNIICTCNNYKYENKF